jgi:WD40 repeat protein
MTKIKILQHVFATALILVVFALVFVKTHEKQEVFTTSYYPAEDDKIRVDFLLDSTYEIVIDTTIDIYKVKTNEKISSLDMFYDPIRSIVMHPSGSHLVILGEYSFRVYDLKKDNRLNKDIETDFNYDYPEVDITDMDYIEFSADGKYLIVVDWADVEVTIYKWPGLKLLITENIGNYRNTFWWENRNGKLFFFYEYRGDKKYIYQMVFPADLQADTLRFSKTVCINSMELKDDE